MTGVTDVVLSAIPVMYVAGDRTKSIPQQAKNAFTLLEAKLPTLRGRRFYGVVLDGEYRACVAIDQADDPAALPHPPWTIPGGKYARTKIADWESRTHEIGPAFETFRRQPNHDPERPCIEFYRSRKELYLMAPVK